MTKETLVLIPGAACDKAVWQHQIDNLSSLCHIHVPELANCHSLEAMVEECIQALPKQFLLAGHSLGGCIALEIMKKIPQRVKKLCLLSTSAAADNAEMKRNRLKRISMAETGHYRDLAKELAEQFTYKKSIVDDVYQMFLRNKDLFIQQQKNILLREESQSLLKKIQQQTLVIVGKQDAFFFASTRKIAASITNATFEVIDECGHMVTMEEPQLVTKLMKKWLLTSSCNIKTQNP